MTKTKPNNTHNISVSVIVTVYESSESLDQCLDSLLNQTIESLEVVIVNDCSSDPDDDRICKKYESLFRHARYIRNPMNYGTGTSRAIGVKAAKGKYIGFLDSDDFVEPYAYEVLVNHASTHDCDLGVANFTTFNGRIPQAFPTPAPNSVKFEILDGRSLFEYQILRINRPYYLRVDWWNKIYKRSLFITNNFTFPPVVRNEGTASMIMSLLAGKCVIVDASLFYTSTRSKSVSRNFKETHLSDTILSSGHFKIWLKDLGVLSRYHEYFVRFFFFVIFNKNIQQILRLEQHDRQRYLKLIISELRNRSDVWRDFLRYVSYKDKSIERLIFATLSTKTHSLPILQEVTKTQFYARVGGQPNRIYDKRSAKIARHKVTVVTITKDLVSQKRLTFFRQMLASVAAQTFGREHIEHIVIDAASRDGTVEVLDQLAGNGALDRWLSEPDSGIYNAMNKASMVATGDYILYLNSDDYLDHNAIQELFWAIKDAGADYAFGNASKVDDSGRQVGRHIGDINKVFFGAPYCHQTLLCSKDSFSKVWFDESYRITMWSYALKLYQAGFISAYVNRDVANFRVGGISTDPMYKEEFIAEQSRIKKERIVPRLSISFDEYQYLNSFWRGWDVSGSAQDLHEILLKLERGRAPFEKAFYQASMALLTTARNTYKSRDQSIQRNVI